MNTMTESTIAVDSGAAQAAERHQLFEDAPVAYHEIDPYGVIRAVNQAECQLLGYSAEEMIGHPVWEFVAADHRQASRESITKKLSREQPVSIVTREYRRSDGSYLWLEIREKLIETAEGVVVGIRSALIDVTERRQLETEIRRQHDWMRCVFRSATKAVITANVLGHISMMNPAAETITGWREGEALGRAVEQICRVQRDSGEPVDLMSCILAAAVNSNRLRNFVVIDRSGASQPIQWTISPIMNDEDVIIGAMLVVEKR